MENKNSDKVILHCDMNSFYASVELLDYPDLVSKPVAVAGDPDGRHGIILAKNEPAKKKGVVTAETIWQARRKCPDLVLLKAHHEKYNDFYKKINEIYYRFTDLVEPFSIDESWLDVTASEALFGSGEEIAYKIKDTVRRELGLTQSVGVSFSKVFAKMGSEYKKPDAVTVISRENYKDLLWPLPVREMFFVGKATAEKLSSLGIKTIGDLACTDVDFLVKVFGKLGNVLYENANGLDSSQVSPMAERRKIKSVGNGITFKRDLLGEADVLTGLAALSDTVSGRLRKYGLKCSGVKVDIKNPEFVTISRQQTLVSPTNRGDVIKKTAMELIKKNWNLNNPIRLITVTGIGIVGDEDYEQMNFLDNLESGDADKGEKIEKTMDEIREKYGKSSIQIGRIVGNDLGIHYGENDIDDENDE